MHIARGRAVNAATIATTDATARASLSNVCACGFCDVCGVCFTDAAESCDDCGATVRPIDCGGDCYTDGRDYCADVIAEWLRDVCWLRDIRTHERTDVGAYLVGSGVGWDYGYAMSDVLAGYGRKDGAYDILNALEIRGAYSLEIRRDARALTIVRRSHDELGALFHVYPARTCPLCRLEHVPAYGATCNVAGWNLCEDCAADADVTP